MLDVVANALVIQAMNMISLTPGFKGWDGSKLSSNELFKLIWGEVRGLYGNSPEKDPLLREIGKYNTGKTKDLYPEGRKTFENKIRDGIRNRLKGAFRSIFITPEIKAE